MVCLLQRCVVDAGLLDGLFIERFRRCLRRVRTGFGIEITRSADWLQLHRASEKTETRGEANPAPSVADGSAGEALALLPIKGRAPKTWYSRE